MFINDNRGVQKMKTANISKKLQADLSRAYMGVYRAFVGEYPSRGFARAQSQFNAICIMREIVAAHKDATDNPAIKFLTILYNTHSKIIAKKTMLSPDKDKIEPITITDGTAVVTALNNLENVIAMAQPNVLCVLKRVPNVARAFAQKSPSLKPKQNFSSWLDDVASEADITKLQNDPRYLGKLYNRYIMRQTHR